MPPKNSKPGQQAFKTPIQNNTTGNATSDASNVANEGQNEAGVSAPSNSDIRGAIRSLKEDLSKQSAKMLEAINGIKGDLLSHSRRIGEAEE